MDRRDRGRWWRRAASARCVVALALGLSVAGACGDTPGPRTIRVPADQPTIQAGVDAARSGDLVLIAAGTYRESVRVRRAGVTVRGEDRNAVVLDGEYQRENGIAVGADGVAVENLTVQRYNANGVYFTGAPGNGRKDTGDALGTARAVLRGWRVSYVTAANNGLYGIYAFASRYGTVDHTYVSGHPDSGLYIGQCKPCDAAITESIAEANAIGYYGTNASGGVYVVRSVFRGNRVGVTPNSQNMEALAPQAETVVAGNLVIDNANAATPPVPKGAFGLGIVIGGGTRNTVVRNRVEGNTAGGIVVTDLDEFAPEGNRIEGNAASNNGLDLAYSPSSGAGAAGNCFAANTFATSSPPDIERALPCDGAASTAAGPFPRPTFAAAPPGVDHRTMPLPLAQPSMPGAATASFAPVPAVAPTVDLMTIVVPERR